MDIGRQGDIRDVDRLGEFQLGVEGVAGGRGGDDPGLAGSALPPDLLHEPGRIGVDLPHYWLASGEQRTSTIDLIGDGLTLLTGPSDPRWGRFAESMPSTVPVDVHVVDAGTADALSLPAAGALLARPDGRELRRWARVDAAAAIGLDGSALPDLPGIGSTPGAGQS